MAKTKPKQNNTIRFKCIRCGAYLRVAARFANRYIECPKCKGRTGVPGSQQEADEEGGEYAVKQMAVEVPDECDKCGQPLPAGTVLCTACGYDYRAGKFKEGFEEPEHHNAFIAWMQETNWNRVASVFVVVAILGGIGYFVGNMMVKRSTGGFINLSLFDSQLSQMMTERQTRDVFGEPRERIKIVSANLGGEKFLSVERDADRIRAAGLDPEVLKKEGFTMVSDVVAKKDTLMMLGKPNIAYFLFYANDQQAMMIQHEEDYQNDGEVCNWGALLEKNDDGRFTIYCYGMGPVIGAGGDFKGFYWTQFYAGQVVSADNPSADLTYNPEECWKLWKKGTLRDFSK